MATLDMSLDDIIKSRRTKERGGGRGGGRGRGRARRGGGPTGPPRKGPLRVNARPSAFTIAKYIVHGEVHRTTFMDPDYGLYSGFCDKFFDGIGSSTFRKPKNLPWQRDLLEESLKAAGVTGLDDGGKLYVTNLDIGVTNEDIRELFSEIGELKRYAIHYDKSGRPNGTAEVVFARRSDAFQALKRYNNVQLDGKPMKIEIVGSKPEGPLAPRVNVVGGVNGQRTVVMMPGADRGRGGGAINRISGRRTVGGIKSSRGGGTVNGRGGGGGGGGAVGRGRGRGVGRGGGRGRGRGGGRKQTVDKSADELDKELENYHAMQT